MGGAVGMLVHSWSMSLSELLKGCVHHNACVRVSVLRRCLPSCSHRRVTYMPYCVCLVSRHLRGCTFVRNFSEGAVCYLKVCWLCAGVVRCAERSYSSGRRPRCFWYDFRGPPRPPQK